MPYCATCLQPAVVIVEARSDTTARAAAACPAHERQAHTWAARAGPVTTTHLDPGHDQQPHTLF